MKSKLALLNSTVLTNNGIFKLTDLSLQEARNLVLQNLDNLENCIGHEATALTLSNLLNIEVLPERASLSQVKGQLAIVLKLNGRPQEGKILSQSNLNLKKRYFFPCSFGKIYLFFIKKTYSLFQK